MNKARPTGPKGVTWMAMSGADRTSSSATATERDARERRKSAVAAATEAMTHAALPIALSTALSWLSTYGLTRSTPA